MANYFTPPSMAAISVIRSRARPHDANVYASVRSVLDLENENYCDPHDPCCVRKDPEIFLNQSVLQQASRSRKSCAPQNPFHFEYTIMHRLKLKRMLQMAAERQFNEELTPEQLEEIKKLEDAEDTARHKTDITKSVQQTTSVAASRGTVVAPGGSAVAPTGSAAAPKDSAVAPSGSAAVPKDSAVAPTGSAAIPKDSAVAPTGSAAAPKDSAIAPTGSAAVPKDSAAPPPAPHKKANEWESPVSKNPETNKIPPPGPILVDTEKLQKSFKELTSIALAHEIALNKDFRLKKPTIEETTDPHLLLALNAKEKYWAKIDQILSKKDYKEWKHVIVDLLSTLKTTLIGILPPHHMQLREIVHVELDMRRIEKKIDANQFDFMHFMNFFLEILATLCCPIKDKDVIDLGDIHVPSRRARRTLELMEEVNLDMANFVLSQSRNHIMQSCILFERNNFASFLEAQYKQGNDAMRVTRDWIRRQSIPDRPYNEAMAYAFLEIFDWQPGTEWPETLTLDWNRYSPIREDIKRLTFLAVMVESVYAHATTMLTTTANATADKEEGASFESDQVLTLKHHLLLGKLREEIEPILTIEHVQDPEKLHEGLTQCANKAVSVIDEHSQVEYCQAISDADKSKIQEFILSLHSDDNSSREEYYQKIKEWFVEMAQGEGREKVQPPQNLSVIGALVIIPVMEMIRLMMFNRSVFDILYRSIFDGKCPPPAYYPPGVAQGQGGGKEGKVVLDANVYGNEEDMGNMDPTVKKIVTDLKHYSARTMVYRKSKIDPRTKPMYEADGTPIVPPELQPPYTPPKMSALDRKHYEQHLLETEPTIEEDYEGVDVFVNVGEPDWMFGYTTEQLLKMMERENLVNANKLRRIQERIQQDILHKRVAENLPVFNKTWAKGVETLQKEYCRLQRIMEKGSYANPPGATDEAIGDRKFSDECAVGGVEKKDEESQVNEKGEKIITSRNGGQQFAESPSKQLEGEEKNEGPFEEEFDMEGLVNELEGLMEDDEGYQEDLSSQIDINERAESRRSKPKKRAPKPQPMLDVFGLRILIPEKSKKPVWRQMMSSLERAERDALLREACAAPMLSSLNVCRISPEEQFEGRPSQAGPRASRFGRGNSNSITGSGQLIGRPSVRADLTQMPATSDVPVSSYSSTRRRR